MNQLGDPKDVPAIYRRNALKPARRVSFRNAGTPDQCACLIVALIADKIGFSETVRQDETIDPFAVLDSSRAFVKGAAAGFDGLRADNLNYMPLFMQDDLSVAAYRQGHAFGAASWDACVAAGLVEQS